MRAIVEYFGPIREAAGTASETVDFEPPCTAVDLIAQLAHARGGRFAELLLRDGRLANSVLLAVGDRPATADDPIPLEDGVEIVVLPPISGGQAGR